MPVDFYQLKLKINYNNAGNPYLQYGPQSGGQPPEEFQAGWTEVYDMPITNTIQQNAANAFNLLAARASLLALNYYIFQAELHQASVFKSALPLPGSLMTIISPPINSVRCFEIDKPSPVPPNFLTF